MGNYFPVRLTFFMDLIENIAKGFALVGRCPVFAVEDDLHRGTDWMKRGTALRTVFYRGWEGNAMLYWASRYGEFARKGQLRFGFTTTTHYLDDKRFTTTLGRPMASTIDPGNLNRLLNAIENNRKGLSNSLEKISSGHRLRTGPENLRRTALSRPSYVPRSVP